MALCLAEHEDVVETTAVGVFETGMQNQDFTNNKDTDSDETERTDLGENLCK